MKRSWNRVLGPTIPVCFMDFLFAELWGAPLPVLRIFFAELWGTPRSWKKSSKIVGDGFPQQCLLFHFHQGQARPSFKLTEWILQGGLRWSGLTRMSKLVTSFSPISCPKSLLAAKAANPFLLVTLWTVEYQKAKIAKHPDLNTGPKIMISVQFVKKLT